MTPTNHEQVGILRNRSGGDALLRKDRDDELDPASEDSVTEVADVEGAVSAPKVGFVKIPDDAPQSSGNGLGRNRLSHASRFYDFDGDGQLDDAELALRARDRSGRGHLTNSELHGLMEEHLEAGSKLSKYKTVVIM